MQVLTLNASKKTKSTPVGEIPVDWGCLPFGEVVASSEYGLSLATHPEGNIPILKMNSIKNGRVVRNELDRVNCSPDELARYSIRRGDVLFNRTNSPALVGKTAVAREDMKVVFASYLVRFRLNDLADPNYVGYWFGADIAKARLKEIATSGVSQSNINPSRLQSDFRLPLPPIAEQRKIADILSTWDEALEKLDTLIETEERRKAALAQLLLGGKRRLKGFSSRWQTLQLSEHICFTPRPVQKPSQPFKSLGIRSHGKGTFIKPDFEPSKIALDELYEVRAGDLIVNITFAWEGAITIAGEEADGALVSHRFPTFTFIPGRSTAAYLRHVINQKWFQEKLILVSPGGAGRNRVLNKRDFLRIQVPTPPYDEQLRIGGILDTCDKEIRLHRQYREALEHQKRGLMQRLLTGKLRVAV